MGSAQVRRQLRPRRAPNLVSRSTEQERPAPGLIDLRSIASLQTLAGNRAARSAIRSVQRDPLDATADPNGYTSATGVHDVRKSGMTRIEVTGLAMGLSSGFQSSYKTKSGDTRSDEAGKTAEHPEHMAVVVMPDQIPEGRGLQVILHFHGFGFRGGDPYAGYLVAKGNQNVAAGTVRDVDQEHWEQQLGAVNAGRLAGQPLAAAILAQGRGPEDFGKTSTSEFVQDVLGKVPALSKITDIDVVLSAHSGGGFRISERIDEVTTADGRQVPAAKAGHAPDHATGLVVMFDAEAIGTVAGAATKKVKALAATLKGADEDTARDAIAAMPRFRFYFNLDGAYHSAYVAEWDALQGALARVPEPWRKGGSEITADDVVRFVPVFGEGVDHEHVISGGKPNRPSDQTDKQGSVADALRASLEPTSDRDKAFERSKLPEFRRLAAEARAAEAAVKRAAKEAEKKAKAAQKEAEKAAKKAAKKEKQPGSGAAPRREPGRVRSRSRPAPRGTGSEPTSAPPMTSTPTTSTAQRPGAGWRTSGMVSDYTFTEQHEQVLASQTKDEREADRTAFDRPARKRLGKLARNEKRGTITEAEATELTTLRALSERVAAAGSALKHEDVEEVLVAAGTNVTDWYGALEKGRFLNQPVHVHPALAARLTQAESALVADAKVNPGHLDAAGLGATLIHSVADMRLPKSATGGTSLSMHVFGLAVDLNYTENPFVGNVSTAVFDVISRATSLVDGTAVNIRPKLGSAGAAFDTLSGASKALSTYLSFAGAGDTALAALVRDHVPAPHEPTTLTGWVRQIDKDRAALDGGDFANHTAASQGFMNLDKALVLAMEAAGLTWGGTYGRGKDIMHFDLRAGEGAAIDHARNAHRANT